MNCQSEFIMNEFRRVHVNYLRRLIITNNLKFLPFCEIGVLDEPAFQRFAVDGNALDFLAVACFDDVEGLTIAQSKVNFVEEWNSDDVFRVCW